MPRNPDGARLEHLLQAIESNPGNPPGFFARLIGCQRETISRMLVSLNDRGVLLWEDERGGLWPCEQDGEH